MYCLSNITTIFQNWFHSLLQKLRSKSGFNSDLPCFVETSEKSTEPTDAIQMPKIFTDAIPKNGDFERRNDATLIENRYNYKKKLSADFIPIQKTEGSSAMHQAFRQYDDHLKKRTEKHVYDKLKSPVYIKSMLSKSQYNKIANVTPIMKEVMIGLNCVVYRVSAMIHCYRNKVNLFFISYLTLFLDYNIQRKAAVGMNYIIDRVRTMICRAKRNDFVVSNVSHASRSSCKLVKSLKTSMEMFNDDYCLSETVLGEGYNGKVFLASERQCNGKKVAVKVVKLEEDKRKKNKIVIPAEIYWLEKVENVEGCQKCIAYYVDKKNAVIVTEYRENTIDLFRLIYYIMIPLKEQIKREEIREHGLSEFELFKIFQQKLLSECEVLEIFQQIVSIVARIEECGIAHGDLKPANILIDGNLKVTIIDFDASISMEEEKMRFVTFDRLYPPFEMNSHHQRMKEKYNTDQYGFNSESDKKILNEIIRLNRIGPVTTWSLGTILAQLLLLEPTTFWVSTDLKALESKISASSISPLAKNLLFMCLNQDPNKRPNTKEILEYLQLNLPNIEKNKTEIRNWKKMNRK